jgi:eukaryotic-like serine/threonine-protein kinase
MTRMLLLLTIVGFGILTAPAAAEYNPYTPREVCGSNYRIIDRERHRDDGIHLGTTFLMWNGATGRNCVVTIKYHRVGRLNYIGAAIQRRGGPIRSDGDVYRYYAGPRRVSARGVCVKWSGYVSISETLGDGFVSRWGHCG